VPHQSIYFDGLRAMTLLAGERVPRSPFLPPEWAPQSGVMLTWPHQKSDWKPWLTQVERVFLEIARQISGREKLLIVCRNHAHCCHVRALLQADGVDLRQVAFHTVPSNDVWARDHGPITVVDPSGATLLDFKFDGWGGKYDAALDDRITTRLTARGAFGKISRRPIDMVLEGGSIEVDGSGTLLTTSRCLLNGHRNPHLNRLEIEKRLKALLGIERVLWLNHGYLAGDDTDGHIDMLARFCDPQTIAHIACDDPSDSHYETLKAMVQELRELRTPGGKSYRLVPLPWLKPKYDSARRRLPASYANFLIINETVLVPTYDDPADTEALACLASCFTGRKIIGIPCSTLLLQFGSLHCVTMQFPEGVLS
jgi:Peptidylarginine deiminase and related enzymes